jgi:hypothetical protein
MPKLRTALLAFVALLSLTATAACNKSNSGVGTSLTPPGAAKEELGTAIKALSGQPYHFLAAQGATEIASGTSDGKGAAQFHVNLSDPTSGASVQLDAARVDKVAYLRADFGALAGAVPVLGDLNKKWLRIDAKKLPASLSKQLETGLSANLAPLATAVQTAEKIGNVYRGTVDLSKGALLFNPAGAGKIDDTAKALPFEATVANGVLSTLSVKGLKISGKATDVTLTITDVGKPVAIEKPKGAVAAPADHNSRLSAA